MIILNVYYTLTLVLQLRKPGDTFIPRQPIGYLGHELSHILSPCEQHTWRPAAGCREQLREQPNMKKD